METSRRRASISLSTAAWSVRGDKVPVVVVQDRLWSGPEKPCDTNPRKRSSRPPSVTKRRAKMDDFYAARSRVIPPIPWSTFSPPFSRHRVLAKPDRYVTTLAERLVVSGPVRHTVLCHRNIIPLRRIEFERHPSIPQSIRRTSYALETICATRSPIECLFADLGFLKSGSLASSSEDRQQRNSPAKKRSDISLLCFWCRKSSSSAEIKGA